MHVWLVRHGESTWHQARRFQGARDAELSPRGREQARTLADRLATIASYLCRCLALGLNAVWRLRIDNTSLTRLELPEGWLHSLNDTRHGTVR